MITLPFDKHQIKSDKRLIKLEELVRKYNKKPSLYLLQLLDNAIKTLMQQFSVHSSEHANTFIRWAMRDPISFEMEITFPANRQYSNERIFELSVPKKLRDFSQFQTLLSKISFKNHPHIQEEFDFLLAEANSSKLADAFSYLKSLKNIETRLLETTNAFMFDKMDRYKDILHELLDIVHGEINRVIQDKGIANHPLFARQAIPMKALQETLKSQQNTASLVLKLKGKNDFELGDFTLHFLGGQNNRNWLAVHRETGDKYVVRLEKLLPDLAVSNTLQKNPEITPYMARNYLFFPTEKIREEHMLNEYNIAISEYFSKKDLLSEAYALQGESEDAASGAILDMARQVAEFAYLLWTRDMAYTDIKAENFLLNDEGKIVISDSKSIAFQKNWQVILHGLKAAGTSFKLPEHQKEATVDAQAFMVYQTGILLYVLMSADKKAKPFGTASFRDDSGKIEPFHFGSPLFQTDRGKEIHKLILQCCAENPKHRPSLPGLLQDMERVLENYPLKADSTVSRNN